MTQPGLPEPLVLKLAEAFHDRASGQIDSLLTQLWNALDAGEDVKAFPRRVDASLAAGQLDHDEVLAVAAVAVTRLAVMHHAAEQLADQWASEVPGRGQEAAELRKLVDDHG
jgi:hypothetical protein